MRRGSLGADPEYLAFVEELKKEPAALPSGEAQAARRAAEAADSAHEPAPVAVTPLMAFLLEQQSGKGDRGRTGQQVGSALTQSSEAVATAANMC